MPCSRVCTHVAAALTGVSAKMIRHYESIGLTRPSGRTFANYRLYRCRRTVCASSNVAVHWGFSIKQIESLLALWDNPQRASAVSTTGAQPRCRIGRKIRELQAMQRTLERLVKQRHGDHRPSCPTSMIWRHRTKPVVFLREHRASTDRHARSEIAG